MEPGELHFGGEGRSMRSPTSKFYSQAIVAAALMLPSLAAFASTPQTAPKHDRAFWRAIQTNHYAVPEGESAAALAHELSGYLGSPDPELRDDLAYSILDVWIIERPQLARQELIP